MGECNCLLKPDDGRDDSSCNESHPSGDFICSKPVGHDGPHAACNVVEHPAEVWEVSG